MNGIGSKLRLVAVPFSDSELRCKLVFVKASSAAMCWPLTALQDQKSRPTPTSNAMSSFSAVATGWVS